MMREADVRRRVAAFARHRATGSPRLSRPAGRADYCFARMSGSHPLEVRRHRRAIAFPIASDPSDREQSSRRGRPHLARAERNRTAAANRTSAFAFEPTDPALLLPRVDRRRPPQRRHRSATSAMVGIATTAPSCCWEHDRAAPERRRQCFHGNWLSTSLHSAPQLASNLAAREADSPRP